MAEPQAGPGEVRVKVAVSGLNPSDTNLIGETIIKLAADYLPEGGDVAILSASSTATNQNAWIEAAKAAQGAISEAQTAVANATAAAANQHFRKCFIEFPPLYPTSC